MSGVNAAQLLSKQDIPVDMKQLRTGARPSCQSQTASRVHSDPSIACEGGMDVITRRTYSRIKRSFEIAHVCILLCFPREKSESS
jgi:hypothetical protein